MGRYHTIGTGAVNFMQPFARGAASDLVIDRPFEVQTVVNFFGFLGTGLLPSGRQRSGGPLIYSSQDTLHKMSTTPADEWAPEAWQASIGHETLNARIAAIVRVEDGKGIDLNYANATMLQAPLRVMKARLWQGIAPMSDARWLERRLSKPELHAVSIQHLAAVYGVFDYMNQSNVRERMKRAYNGVYDVLQEFSGPLNTLRKADGFEDDVDLAAAWYEYVEDLFTSISQLAHDWITERIESLMASCDAMLAAHEPDTTRYPAPQPYDAVQWTLTNRSHDLLELSVRADAAIMLPMEGYKGYITPKREDLSVVEKNLFSADHEERLKAFGASIKAKSRYEHIFVEPDHGLPTNHPTAILSAHKSQRKAQHSARTKMRGEGVKVLLEPWAARLVDLGKLWPQSDDNEQHGSGQEPGNGSEMGFLGYRLTHKQSDDEWREFEQHLSDEAHACVATHHSRDAYNVPLAFTVSWQDGASKNIPDNDVEAAKKTFDAHVNSDLPSHKGLVKRDLFLVVDDDAWDAYLEAKQKEEAKKRDRKENADKKNDSTDEAKRELEAQLAALEANPNQSPELVPFATPGLSGCPFVTVVDTRFTLPPKTSKRDEKGSNASRSASNPPSFDGQLRVATHLLFPELYALTELQALALNDLWHLAKRHPRQVYIGPVSRSDEGESPMADGMGVVGLVFSWLWFSLKAYVCFYVLRYMKRLLFG